jgi:DNA-binding GntR family transcriptional regulator
MAFDERVTPLGRTRLVDEVTNHLRTLIITGVLAPGQQLLQTELSEQLGVSRTPLREAFRVLEREGFVRVSNGNNTIKVIELSPDDMVALYEIREVIDGLAARLAAERGIDEQEHENLTEMVRRIARASKPLAPGDRAVAHADLHSRIAQLSGNPHVISQIPMIRLSAQMLARRLQTVIEHAPAVSDDMIEQGADDHQGVVDAIAVGNGKLAERIARSHIRKTMHSPLLASQSAPG